MLLQNHCRLRSGRVPAVCLVLLGSVLQLSGCSSLFSIPDGPADSIVAGTLVGSAGEPLAGAIVFLEPLEASDGAASPPEPATLQIREGEFRDDIAVVVAGQPIEFSSEGDLLHRFFSYNEPNAFELGPQDRSVVLSRPGAVHFYCSLHPAEGGTVFVAPSPHFGVADADGRFQIRSVPPGRYRLETFRSGTRAAQQLITLVPGGALLLNLRVSRSEMASE